ncbi:hypothetical protein ACFPYI_15075 [Halomarina salina]|uniref:Domain of unknown function domain-containing protein n=1 Tax=Halomarina salina TaxID=1872699 RepID=A0ABD5RPT7_9EURY|nr:hypothetical protein [Halomarina salina]
MPSEDRQSGLLRRSDRAYLRGEKEYESQQVHYNKRATIRKRIHNAILDFELIELALRDRDRDKIFENADEWLDEEDTDLLSAIEALIGWIYAGLKSQGYDAEAIFENGIERGDGDLGTAADAKIVQTDVSVIVRSRRIEGIQQIKEKIEAGDPVMYRDVINLARNDIRMDLTDVDEVRVFADSSQVKSERHIIEEVFSEFYDKDITVIMERRQ